MIQKPYRGQRSSKNFITANLHIRYPQVRVLAERGETLGVMTASEALKKAQEAGKDLVLITAQAQPPVVKIIELSKHKYQLQQKQSADRKRAKVQGIKEVRFSPFMGEQDFEGRLKKTLGFLEKGSKVRLTLMFKGRQIAKKEFGYAVFDKVIERTTEKAVVEMQPKLLGKKLIAQLSPLGKKKKKVETNEKTETKNP